ncbi:MAG: hypothetical protein EOO85_23950, partial [Pedobacter sp.]
PKNSWFPNIQVLASRQKEGSAKGLFFAAKGGTNFESHNHNDVGSFVIYKDGNPVVVDPGVGIYTKQTFGPDRYEMWYMQSSWHNCPTINGAMQQAGRAFVAKDVKYSNFGMKVSLSMDIASAYPPSAKVKKWSRAFQFDSKRGSLQLTEDYELSEFKTPSVLNFLVNGSATETSKGKIKLTNNQNNTVYLSYDPERFIFTKEVKDIEDQKLKKQWNGSLTKIILTRKDTLLVGNYNIEFN